MERRLNILIFGYGAVAQERYLPSLRAHAQETEPPVDLRVQCVDKGRAGCYEVDDWWDGPGIRLQPVDKILVLSPPGAHYENLSSIMDVYASRGIAPPEIYVEKPVYLHSEWDRWVALLTEHPLLDDRGFYVDHYRFKEALDWFETHGADVLEATGPVLEIGFVSLEKQGFWESPAFQEGYFLEHACHLVGMFDRAFPGIAALEWVPRPIPWMVWEQVGRPPSCGRDSASLSFLRTAGGQQPGFAQDAAITLVIGKGMVDLKVLHLRGERGSAQIWFNAGKVVLKTPDGGPVETALPVGDAHQAVVESILAPAERPSPLLTLRQGMAQQEKVISIRRHFPDRAGTYAVGEVPLEISSELARMGLITT